MTFDDVSYFGDEYRGDLVITHGVIYYFPHTNVALQKEETGYGAPVAFRLLIALIYLVSPVTRDLVSTTNQPELREMGLWRDGESSQSLQARLDAYIAGAVQAPQHSQFEYGLPRPMRFARADIKNISMRGGLRFDTECDNHAFSIGLRRKRRLREALWEGGFTH
jgi:hypothetical protein